MAISQPPIIENVAQAKEVATQLSLIATKQDIFLQYTFSEGDTYEGSPLAYGEGYQIGWSLNRVAITGEKSVRLPDHLLASFATDYGSTLENLKPLLISVLSHQEWALTHSDKELKAAFENFVDSSEVYEFVQEHDRSGLDEVA